MFNKTYVKLNKKDGEHQNFVYYILKKIKQTRNQLFMQLQAGNEFHHFGERSFKIDGLVYFLFVAGG